MKSRLVGTVAVTAALSSCLSVGLMQVFSTTPAGAAPRASQAGTAPTDTDLLTEIAANTSTTNGKLHVIGGELRSILAADENISAYTDVSAKRAKIINHNLILFYKTMKSDLSYQDPSKGNHYSGNEAHLIEFTLCDMDFWLQSINADGAPIGKLPPCR